MTNNEVMDELEILWLEQLVVLNVQEKEQIQRRCREVLSSKKTKERREQLLSKLL